MADFPHLGFGCGLRTDHLPVFQENGPSTVSWLEIIAENYLDWTDGRRLRSLEQLDSILQNYPVVAHGVSLSLGSTDPLDKEHLRRVRDLLDRTQAKWFSDHLCWTGVDGVNLHDLMPLPYTEEAIDLVSNKITQVQDFLKRRILIENVSSYVTFADSQMPEWEFIGAILNRADCGILLDINNVYVSGFNHGYDPKDFLNAIAPERIGQIHLAGHRNKGTHLIDTHDEAVCDGVWDLYRWFCEKRGTFTTMIEWDDRIPEWSVLEAEVLKARQTGETRSKDVEAIGHPATF